MPNTRIHKDSPLPPRHLAPLDRRELRRERARAATRSSWRFLLALLIAGVSAHYLFHIPAGLVLIGIALIIAIRWYLRFQSSTPGRRREISEDLIDEESRRGDDRLATAMRALSDDGFDGYAITLGKFLQHKRAIESELAKRGVAGAPQAKQLAGTVDSICSGVAEQFQRVTSVEKHLALLQGAESADEREEMAAERREILCQVIEAYKVLKSTRQDLASIIDQGNALAAPDASPELGTIIDRLRQEAEIARNTRERLRRDGVTTQSE